MHIRRTLAIGALSALALGGLAGTAPASADEPLDCATIEEVVAAAEEDFHAARVAFTQSLRPMGRLIRDERAEARADARESRVALRAMGRQLERADDRQERRETVAAMRAERKELAATLRLLDSKRRLRAEARQSRLEAKAEWDAAKAELRAVRQFRDECEAETGETGEPGEPGETEPTTP